jgi:hypothetical protein
MATGTRRANVERPESVRLPECHLEQGIALLTSAELVRRRSFQRKIRAIDADDAPAPVARIVVARAERCDREKGEPAGRHEPHACATESDGSSARTRWMTRVCTFVTQTPDADEFVIHLTKPDAARVQ